jgi:tetratricopeptide (TPR) repeat protein
MSTVHPDEATLLRSVFGELPERRQADLRRHVARCRLCRKAREATKRLHARLSRAGDSLAFSADDPFERRPAWRDVKHAGRPAAETVAAAVGRLASEKQRILAALEVDAAGAARALDLDDPACRLAAAHVLEEAAAVDPSGRLADFAAAIAGRALAAGEAEAVLPGAQLGTLAHLVHGNWRLFIGRKDEAAADFRAAWAELGTFDAPEHLCGWVEVGEALRRSYDGRPVEGRLLAERALETFERYGLGRGILRARHARAVALYTGSEFREAHREFRAVLGSKDATGLDRARAVSGAAFCLAARGRFYDAAKEHSPVRRRLRGEGAMTQQYLLQGEMKVALGTAGRWHPRRDGLAPFELPEAAGAFHARETAAEVVKAVSEEGLEKAKELLGKIEADPSRGYTYLYACQLAYPKVPSDPMKYVEFARAISRVLRRLPYIKHSGPAQPVCCEQTLGEAGLLESIALNSLGRPAEARKAAQKARIRFIEPCEDFALAFVDFTEGSAATFECDFNAAWKLLKAARGQFESFGQENWQGRSDAALGTVMLGRGKNESAVVFFEKALRNLHPVLDEVAYASTIINHGASLVGLGQLDLAKSTFARGLVFARRLNLKVGLYVIRYDLATIELLRNQPSKALALFQRIREDARREGFASRVLSADLRIAECLGRLGQTEEMTARLRELRNSDLIDTAGFDSGLRELFATVDQEAVSTDLLAHVAQFIEGRDRGSRVPYKPFRLVAKRN